MRRLWKASTYAFLKEYEWWYGLELARRLIAISVIVAVPGKMVSKSYSCRVYGYSFYIGLLKKKLVNIMIISCRDTREEVSFCVVQCNFLSAVHSKINEYTTPMLVGTLTRGCYVHTGNCACYAVLYNLHFIIQQLSVI